MCACTLSLALSWQEIPSATKQPDWTGPQPVKFDWEAEIKRVLEEGKEVPEVDWCKPGEDEAWEVCSEAWAHLMLCLPYSPLSDGVREQALVGAKGFIPRIKGYHELRNDPNKDACSNLSPYLHFGHLSAQEMAVEVSKHKDKFRVGLASWLAVDQCTRSLSIGSGSCLVAEGRTLGGTGGGERLPGGGGGEARALRQLLLL